MNNDFAGQLSTEVPRGVYTCNLIDADLPTPLRLFHTPVLRDLEHAHDKSTRNTGNKTCR